MGFNYALSEFYCKRQVQIDLVERVGSEALDFVCLIHC